MHQAAHQPNLGRLVAQRGRARKVALHLGLALPGQLALACGGGCHVACSFVLRAFGIERHAGGAARRAVTGAEVEGMHDPHNSNTFQQSRVRALRSAPLWHRVDAQGSRRRASARFVN